MTQLRAFIVIFSICCHLFAAMTPANAQANQISHQFAQSDIAPICTGNGVVWVSLAQFYQTGELLVVEPPTDENVPDHNQLVKCSLCTLFSSADIDDQALLSQNNVDAITQALAIFAEPAVTVKSATITTRARSPPQFLS